MFFLPLKIQDDDEEGGEQYDLAKLSKENAEENPEEAPVKVHEIKFDEYGIMDDGLDTSTNEQLKNLEGNNWQFLCKH